MASPLLDVTANNGSVDEIRLLLDHLGPELESSHNQSSRPSSSPLDVRTSDGETALHLACAKGRRDIVDCLIAAGASVNVQDMVSIISDSCMMVLHLFSAGFYNCISAYKMSVWFHTIARRK